MWDLVLNEEQMELGFPTCNKSLLDSFETIHKTAHASIYNSAFITLQYILLSFLHPAALFA